MALKLGVACLHVGKGAMGALLGACFVAVAGTAALTSYASPFAPSSRLSTATSASGFVCAGLVHLDPLDPWILDKKLHINKRIGESVEKDDQTKRKGAPFEERAENG